MSTNIFTTSYDPPRGFDTALCSCFYTDPELYKSDFDAVISSREELRIWSDSEWPEDDFTPEVNREELQFHVDDNNAHEAYGYMLYDPTRTHCYGSLYVNATTEITDNYEFLAGTAATLSQFDARIDYWLSTRARKIHLQLSQIIYRWVKDEWRINPGFTVRERATDRIELYETLGLKRTHVLKYHKTGTKLYIYT